MHPSKWYLNWYNIVGLSLAMRQSFDEIAKHYEDDPEMLEIVSFLKEGYTSSAWSER